MNDKNQLEEKVYEYELAKYKTSSSKLDSLQLERLLNKVEDMEQRHSQEMNDLTQTQSQLMLTKEQEILQISHNTNKELNRMKSMVKSKNDEIEKLKR